MAKRLKRKKIQKDSSDESDTASCSDSETTLLPSNYGYNLHEKLSNPLFIENARNIIKKVQGHDFDVAFCRIGGFRQPLFFEKPDGLEMTLPKRGFGIRQVEELIGSDRLLDVMDVRTQTGLKMPMKDFVKYYRSKSKRRKRQLLNVLSLEFSVTKLHDVVQGPRKIKEELDWVELVWPEDLRSAQTDETNAVKSMMYPKVQNYCLMSVKRCYTDFHVDFGGTSVWYHVFRGGKIFWLAPPSRENLSRFREWSLSGNQPGTFFGDLAENCCVVQLKAGHTFMIPSGWIHAVYTPKDSLVFGGNFLHSYAISNQLDVNDLENKLRVPSKFRYPFFQEIHWYILNAYFAALTGVSYLKNPETEILSQRPLPQYLYKPNNLNQLTKPELKGLHKIVDYLQKVPQSKRKCPDRITKPDILLLNCEEILKTISATETLSVNRLIIDWKCSQPMKSISTIEPKQEDSNNNTEKIKKETEHDDDILNNNQTPSTSSKSVYDNKNKTEENQKSVTAPTALLYLGKMTTLEARQYVEAYISKFEQMVHNTTVPSTSFCETAARNE